ncbi:radical SAM protein [bacterium]|nr:radical SAM protein [bacterium]
MKKIKYLSRFFLIYFAYILKKQKVNYSPVKLWIETSARCNLQCRLCVNKDMPVNMKGDMDFNLYKKIIDEVKDYVFEINLFHRGEPLLHPQIIEMIEYAGKNNIKTSLHTNGVLLNHELSGRLIASGLNMISFSFDGYTKATYEKNRVGAVYENTLKNIIDFLKIKKELNSVKPFTSLQVMEFDEEISTKQFLIQKREFTKNFINLPLNKFIIRTPHNWGGLLDIASAAKAEKNKIKLMNCTFPWYALTIFYDGKVYPCPQDFYGELQVGDVNKDCIKLIFNNEKIQDIRKSFANKKTDNLSPCCNCDRCRRDTFLGVPKEYLGIFLRDSLRKD